MNSAAIKDLLANKNFFAIKCPGGYVKGVLENGEIEVTKESSQAEWNNENVARCLARFVVGQFPQSKRFEIYPFKVTKIVCTL